MNILCVGQLVADVVVWSVDALPVPGRTDIVAELQLVTGGCAANTANVLAKFAADASIVPVVDTTCAGDSFVAGFPFGISQGWLLDDALDFANAAGGLCTTQISRCGISSFAATREFALGGRLVPPAHARRTPVSLQAEDLS